MIKIKLMANMAYQTARMNTQSDFEKFLSKNNDAKNWDENQMQAIIINNVSKKDKKSATVANVDKASINSLLLNVNLRNDDGCLHNINITIYANEDQTFDVADAQSVYNTYLVSNPTSQDMFKNARIENAIVKTEAITKIDCLKELNSHCINPKSMAKLLGMDDLSDNLSILDNVTKFKIDNTCSSEEEFRTKRKKELDENTELRKEVDRIFNTKNNSRVNYISYYFDNRNIYNKNIELLVEALYAAGRIKECEYYELNVNVFMVNLKNVFAFFKKLLRMTTGLYIHFSINFNAISPQACRNIQIEDHMNGDGFKNAIAEIKKIQYSTICSFDIDIDNCSNKYFMCETIFNLFQVVPFYNELNEQQALNYAKSRLKENGLMDLENRVISVVKSECDKNDNGLCKADIEEIILDVERRIASSIYEKEYITNDIDINKIVGLRDFKKELIRIKNSLELSHMNDSLSTDQTNKAIFNMNYRFEGESGVGKTYAATLLSKYLYSVGIINTNAIIRAYSIKDVLGNFDNLVKGGKGDELHQYLEEDGHDLLIIEGVKNATVDELNEFLGKLNKLKEHNLVIVCGNEKDFTKLDNSVPLFKSKFPKTIKFETYSTDELIEILTQKLEAKKYKMCESAVKLTRNHFDKVKKTPHFSNATFVENYAESIINNSLNRIFNNSTKDKDTDAYLIIDSDVENVDMTELLGNDYKMIESYENAMSDLDNLIGLSTVKSYIKSYIAKSKIDKMKRDLGCKSDEGLNMNLCFTGHPGTAKTTVARQFAKIMYMNGITTKPNIVECGLSDLQAEYLGQTSPKVIQRFEEAKGGVLFIDEAYSLNNDDVYSKQTIDTIVAQMENNRDEVIVIFAGYREPMEEFIKSNPGIKGRVSRFLDFPNYSLDELMEIFDKMIADKKYILDDEESVKSYVRNFLEEKMEKEDFANGREVRLLIENAILNQSMRLFEEDKMNGIDKDVLMTLKLDDFVDESGEFYKENKVGFIA